MKAKLLTLLMALFALAESANAYFYYNDFNIYITARNDRFRKTYEYKYYFRDVSEDIVIEDSIKSLKFYWLFYLSYDFTNKEELTELKLWYTVYNTLEGGPSENCVWKSHDIPLDQQSISYFGDTDGSSTIGSGTISRYYFPGEEGLEIIEDEWLGQNLSKTLIFYFEGKDKYGTSHCCKNGEEYFKVSFKIGEGANKIKFSEQETSSLFLNYYVNREERHGANICFNGDGSFSTNDEDGVMPAQDDFGEISSLLLYGTDIWFDYADDLGLNDVDASFMYKVYEEGHGNEADWNKLDLEEQELHGNRVKATIYGSDGNYLTDFAEGLALNKNYVLEVYYQVMVGKECYTLGKNKEEGTKFKFTPRTAQIIEGAIKSLMLAYSLGNNDVEFPMLPESGFPETILQEPISSFKIYGGEAVTEETIQTLELLIRSRDADYAVSEAAWQVIPFTDNGFGMWTIELPEPKELVREYWQEEHKRITFELYIEARDQNGDLVLFDNGGEGYRFTFTCGEDTSAKGVKSFTLTIDFNSEVAPIPVPATDVDEIEVPFPLYGFKVLKAEVNTYTPMKAVYFFSSLYNTADGISYDESAWEVTSLEKQDNNKWGINIPNGKDLIKEEWLLQNTRMRKTYAFFVRAEGEDGNDYFFNNGDELYKITFTCDDADGIREMKNEELRMKNDEPIYNLAGQKMVNGQSSMVNDKLPRGIYIVGGRKVLR